MSFLIYKKSNGKLIQISDVSGVWTAEDTIASVYGPNGVNVFGAIEYEGDFPVGKMVVDGALVDDIAYVPPPPPAPPVVEQPPVV